MLLNHYSHARPRINRPRNLRRSKLRVSLALLALALLALALLAAPYAARAQVQPKSGGGDPSASALKVMTWNMRGGKAKQKGGGTQGCKPKSDPDYVNDIANEITRYAGLDVIALQEVYRKQAEDLKPKLFPPGTKSDLFFVRTLKCNAGPDDDFGIAIISRYKFLEGQSKSGPLCFSPFGDASIFDDPLPGCPGKTKEPRVLARAVIRVAGNPIFIYNTHLPPRGSVHKRMAELINSQFDRDKPDWAVLLGDFYMDDGSAAYREILKKFRDTWPAASSDKKEDCDGKGSTHPTLPKPTQQEDYVFVSKEGFRVDSARVTCTKKLLEAFGLTTTSPNVKLRVPDHLPLTVGLAVVN